jgi:hypothetical protein
MCYRWTANVLPLKRKLTKNDLSLLTAYSCPTSCFRCALKVSHWSSERLRPFIPGFSSPSFCRHPRMLCQTPLLAVTHHPWLFLMRHHPTAPTCGRAFSIRFESFRSRNADHYVQTTTTHHSTAPTYGRAFSIHFESSLQKCRPLCANYHENTHCFVSISRNDTEVRCQQVRCLNSKSLRDTPRNIPW